MKKLLLVLLIFTLTIGEEKLFYNSKNIILYNIDSQGIKIIKEKNLKIEDLAKVYEILENKKINTGNIENIAGAVSK